VKNGKEEIAMKRSNEKGTAMLFAIILVLVLSVMAASMMFPLAVRDVVQHELPVDDQARYGAEAGIHMTANFCSQQLCAPGSHCGCAAS